MCNASTRRGGIAANARAALALWLLMTAGIARAENNPVVFQSTDTPPFWSASLPDNGMGGAMLKLLSDAAGVQYSIEYLPVQRFRNSLAAYIVGDPDILIYKEHLAVFPIGIFQSAFFYYKPHHEAIEFHRLQDLQGYTLGVLRGTIEDKGYFAKIGINVEESDSVESLLKKLKKGRVDLCILISETGQYAINRTFPHEQDNFAQAAIQGSDRPIAIMIDVSVPEGRAVAQRYRRVLENTLHSPKYHDILEQYYGKNRIPVGMFEQLKKFERVYASDWDK